MSINKDSYIHVPKGLNLDWGALLAHYPDDVNRCYLVALDGRKISVLLDLTTSILPWYWLWKIDKEDAAAKQSVTDFKNELEHCLMSGCDVSLMLDKLQAIADAITNSSAGDDETVAQAIVDQTTVLENALAITIPGKFDALNAELDESLTALYTVNANRNDRLGEINSNLAYLSSFPDLVTRFQLCCQNSANKARMIESDIFDHEPVAPSSQKCGFAAIIIGHALSGLQDAKTTTEEKEIEIGGILGVALAWVTAYIEAIKDTSERILSFIISVSSDVAERVIGDFVTWSHDGYMVDVIAEFTSCMSDMVCAINNAATPTAARSAINDLVLELDLTTSQKDTLIYYVDGLNIEAAFGGTGWNNAIGGDYLEIYKDMGDWYTGDCSECASYAWLGLATWQAGYPVLISAGVPFDGTTEAGEIPGNANYDGVKFDLNQWGYVTVSNLSGDLPVTVTTFDNNGAIIDTHTATDETLYAVQFLFVVPKNDDFSVDLAFEPGEEA